MITIEIKRSIRRRKTVQLRGISKDSLEMHVPKTYNLERLADIIAQNTAVVKRAASRASQSIPEKVYSGTAISIFGDIYTVVIARVGKVRQKEAYFSGKTITIESSGDHISKREFYIAVKGTLSQYMIRQIHEYSLIMGELKYTRVSFKSTRTIWGSCSSRGSLSFNTRLIHYPKQIIDYVIVHELAHIVHRDHSSRFWKFVEKFYPHYKEARQLLKSGRYG